MSEREDTLQLRPEPRQIRRQGSGRLVLALAAIAIVATAVYLLLAPTARRELTRFNARFVQARVTPVAALPTRAATIDELESEVSALRQRVAALEQRVGQTAPTAVGMQTPTVPGSDALFGALSSRLDAIAARQDRQEATLSEAKTRLAVSDHRFRLLEAATALAAGQPIGIIPDAPPALARFAAAAPPTEAGLRATFPAVAHAARAAARPSVAQIGLWGAIKARLSGLLTIRQGQRLVFGDSANATIDGAEMAVNADDLAGAVAALSRLTGAPAEAAAVWRDQAQALLDAQAALARMEAAE